MHEMIQPVLDVADIFVPNDDTAGWVQVDPDGHAFIKPLWASADSGGWAALFRWNAGYVAPPHKHQGAIHAFIVSGRLRVRDHEMGPGDYTYEPNGIIHDATEAVEDTVHLNIGDGPVLFFDDSGITRYFGWEQVTQLQARVNAGQVG